MNKVRFSRAAQAEAREAATWYAERDPEWAARFRAELEAVVARIAERPGRFAPFLGAALPFPVRKAFVRGFPYTAYFAERPRGIHIYAVAHQSRSPGYWFERLR